MHVLRAVALLMISVSLRAQDLPLNGIVISNNDKPLAGVSVYASPIYRRESTATDERGHFVLQHPGKVVHFWGEGLQPRVLIVKPGDSNITVTVSPTSDVRKLPACGNSSTGDSIIREGNLEFRLPSKGVRLQRGKWDVDYVRHVVRPQSGKAYMALWFGPMAFSLDPSDEIVLKSSTVEQREIVEQSGHSIGMESWGRMPDGSNWRHLGIVGSGGVDYKDANPEDAALFDHIIDSVCQIPPRQD